MTAAAELATQPEKSRFLLNVLWGWAGVVVNIVIAFVLSPIIVRKLGVERYGVWVLLFSVMDYLRMLDFGFRAAVVNACARCNARADWEGVNRILSPAMLYFVVVGVGCLVIPIAFRDSAMGMFNIPPAHVAEARSLIGIIAVSIAMRLMLSPLTATLEGFQRFDIVNRAYLFALVFRSIGSLTVLLAGYGLVEMGYVLLAGQLGENAITLIGVRKVFPQLHLSPALVKGEALLSLFRYGRHSAAMGIANLISIQIPTTILGYSRGPAEVAFFALPFRLLMYTAEVFAKVADVTSSVTAAYDETRKRDELWRLVISTNRHCLALFVPLAVFLMVFGIPLLRVYMTPEFADRSGPLIPVLTVGFLFAVAGQYNASAVLIGQGKHAWYAYGIAVEVMITAACLLLFTPANGALAAAWIVTLSLLVVRGLYLAVVMCRVNGFHLPSYLRGIYGRALATAAPAFAVAFAIRAFVWPGRNWPELIAAGGVIALLYFTMAFFTVLEPDDRNRLVARVRRAG